MKTLAVALIVGENCVDEMQAIHFYYENLTNHRSENEAFEIVEGTDNETKFFEFYK